MMLTNLLPLQLVNLHSIWRPVGRQSKSILPDPAECPYKGDIKATIQIGLENFFLSIDKTIAS